MSLTRVPLGAVQALLGSRLHCPASLDKKLLSQGVTEPAQGVRNGTPLRAAQALSLAEEVALGKGESETENDIQGKQHTTQDKGHSIITAHTIIAGHTGIAVPTDALSYGNASLQALPRALPGGVMEEEATTHC